MTRDPVTLPEEAPVVKAAKPMRDKDVHQLPVVVDGRPVGVVALADLSLALDPAPA
ncbi:CBS domain-containing protein [Microbispora sp. GKU 823]|uniref:CBS domain-containing protein n=1 Tax=Microbispora sp. GKU 823 TaxID=1652100 RepID=UPI00117E24EC|nr:CBS domain-containing protein [Microbispora sp. GKU 823]